MKCGTMQCLAPEALCDEIQEEFGGGYGYPSEYWSLGVLLYEMLVGRAPFVFDAKTESAEDFAKRMADPRTQVDIPITVSSTAASLLRGLLQKSPKKRFGADDIRRHRMFSQMDWGALAAKRLPAPWVPASSSPQP